MVEIIAYEHVGIRVSDREESVRFYEKLGFKEVNDLPEHNTNEMISDNGVHLNLIFNAEKREGRKNILYDEKQKFPGITHPAFIINDMQHFIAHCEKQGIQISDGPLAIGVRRTAVFLRDPDGNVLEFDEMH